MIYQYIGLLVGIIAIIITFLRFKDGKMSLNLLMVWSGIWILLIIFSVYPEATSILALVTGIGRGLDIILILGLIGCYYLIFRIYDMIEKIEEDMTELVREIALKNDDSGQKSAEERKVTEK